MPGWTVGAFVGVADGAGGGVGVICIEGRAFLVGVAVGATDPGVVVRSMRTSKVPQAVNRSEADRRNRMIGINRLLSIGLDSVQRVLLFQR
jgi:hypothetical protein